MKKYLYSWFPVIASALIILLVAASGQVAVPANTGQPVSKTSKTYAASQVDTVTFAREAGLSGLSFAGHWKDSVNVTSCVLRRVIDGVAQAVVSTDTLWGADSSATAKVKVATVTLAPLPDVYWFIVTYSANHGAIDQGVTTPTAVYELNKQYSMR